MYVVSVCVFVSARKRFLWCNGYRRRKWMRRTSSNPRQGR